MLRDVTRALFREVRLGFRLGTLGCLLAGCTLQPTSPDPTGERARLAALLGEERPVLRIGLEYLPPDERLPAIEPVRVEPRCVPAPASAIVQPIERARLLSTPEPSRTPYLSRERFADIEDPVARETMLFVTDLVDADRQRAQQGAGVPFFDFCPDDGLPGPQLHSERRLREAQQQWVQENGSGLLNRPSQALLRRLPLVHELELELESFQSNHVPLSEPYRQAHADQDVLGRLSVRLRANLEDPVELLYLNHGLRLASTRDRGRATLNVPLTERLMFSIYGETLYATGDAGVRCDLAYRPTPRVSVHVSAGDDMDYLSTSTMYSLFHSPMDGSAGIVLYAVHTF